MQRTFRNTFVIAALAACCAGAQATHVGEDLVADQQTVAANDQLLDALARWENAAPAARAQQAERLVQQAAQRQRQLLRLLDRNPQVGALRLLPQALRERFPAAAREQLEQPLDATGDIAATISDDFDRGVSRKQFVFRSGSVALAVRLADASGGERDLLGWAGKRVSVRGMRVGDRLVVTDKRQVTLAADGSGFGGSVVAATTAVQGNQNTLVILTNFSDAPLACTAADVNTRVFGTTGSTVNTSFRESSRNLVSFSGRVIGPFNINYSSGGSCDYSGWANAADAAARANGVDPSQYQRVNYVTPRNSSCGWSGLAYMPGRQSWVQACGSTGLYTHELGHNLSLHHATTPGVEYGDATDPMGSAYNVRNNGANQAMAGWLPAGGVIDVSGGGSYALDALSPTTGSAPQVLRLRKADTNEYYYVSLRQATGVDSVLPTAARNAIAVHRSTGTLPAKTVLLAQLAVGQSFTDSTNGILVTHQGLAGSTSTVGVTIGGGSCTRAAPTVAVSPASQTAAPGANAAYTLTVTNRNSSACGSGSFALAQALPAGFGGGFANATLSVAAGASASTTWTVASPTTVAPASYTLDATASEAGGGAVTAHAAYVVSADATPPSITSVTPGDGAVITARTTQLSATASDASGIAAVEFYADGKLLARDTAAPYGAAWNARKAGRGAHTLTVRAIDMLGNAAVRNVAVTVN